MNVFLRLPITTIYVQLYYNKIMQLTEKHTFKTTVKQKQTLILLHDKYNINTSKFIRDAINEKLQREKDSIFKEYKKIQKYLKEKSEIPF